MYTLPQSLRIGVLRGGQSPEYDLSLKNGANVLRYLNETHKPVDIFVAKDGKWYVGGLARPPEKILQNVDVVWNSLHGSYGENNQIHELLDSHKILYTGSDRYNSTLANNRLMVRGKVADAGVKVAMYKLVKSNDSLEEKAKEIFNTMPHPVVVKPVFGRMSQYPIAESFFELVSGLNSVLSSHPGALVEEYIKGKNVFCVVTENFRNKNLYAFPPVSKMSISKAETEKVEDYAKRIHQALNLSHFSEPFFIVTPRRGIYFSEINTTPQIKETGTLKKSLESVGSSIKEFIHHILDLAIHKSGLWV